jgi:hypothetical protein
MSRKLVHLTLLALIVGVASAQVASAALVG